MNQRNPLFMIVALCLSGGPFVMLSILLGGGNEVAAFYEYLLAVLFIGGFVAPRGAFIFWLVLCGYTDLLKRFLVVTGHVTFADLYYVLGIPPVMIGAITMSVLLGVFSGRFHLRRFHWAMFGLACLIILAVAGLAAKESSSIMQSVLPAIANSGLYFMLIFLVPVLFPTTDEVLKMLRLLLWAYLPVALYGIFQQIYGYRDFEIEYLKSGLSIEVKQLINDEVRAFSTLNSTTSLATVSAVLFSTSLILLFLPVGTTRRRAFGWLPAMVMAAAYLGGLLASTGRAAFALIAFSLFGWLCFRSKRLTIAAYLVCSIGFLALVFSADILLANMSYFQDEVSSAVGDQKYMTQMTRVGTYSDRLMGFSNLVKSPDVWTLFGHGAPMENDDRSLFSHDILTNSLVQNGAVPVGVAAVLLIIGLFKAHRGVLRILDSGRRTLAAALLALALSFLVLALLAGNVLVIFPINVFACLFCGMMIAVSQHDQDVCELAHKSIVKISPAPEAQVPPRAFLPFARDGHMWR